MSTSTTVDKQDVSTRRCLSKYLVFDNRTLGHNVLLLSIINSCVFARWFTISIMSVYATYISSLLADSTHMMRLKQMLYLALMMTLTCSLQTRYSLGLRYVCCVCACVCVHACVHVCVTLRLYVWNVRFCAPDGISFPISLYLYYIYTYIWFGGLWLLFTTQVWLQYPTQLVGFPPRVHRWDETTQKWMYESQWLSNISMVLTGAAFYHKVATSIWNYKLYLWK